MQATNKPLKQIGRCMYCGSTSRGRGCRYGPSGVHFHADDSTKCSYCGSTSYGRGCKINPFNDLHVHGTSFNNMYKEYVQSVLDNKILLKELKKDFKDFEAFKLGIIDERGNKIKTPITESEIASFSPIVKTILKIKKYLGPKVDLLTIPTQLTENKIDLKNQSERYVKLLMYRDKIADSINELYQTIDEAKMDGFSFEDVVKEVRS